jgi:hypothetical protein
MDSPVIDGPRDINATNEPDTDLVKCIDAKFANGEFEEVNNSQIIGFVYMEWVCDSTMEVKVSNEYEYNDEDEFVLVDKARVQFEGNNVELTDNENLRIIEIVKAYEEKANAIKQKIEKTKEDSLQLELRSKITKYCE